MLKFNVFQSGKEVSSICKSLCRHGFSNMDIHVETPYGSVRVGTASFCSVSDLWEDFSKSVYYIRVGVRGKEDRAERFIHLVNAVAEGVRLETLRNAFNISPALLLDFEEERYLPEEEVIFC